MPNHVRNIVKMKGISSLPIYNEKNALDFNKIILMPESLDLTSGTSEKRAVEAVIRMIASVYKENMRPLDIHFETPDSKFEIQLARCDTPKEEILKSGLLYIQNIVSYGAPTWYEWHQEHWGTKWNAYEFVLDNPDQIRFSTAWAPSIPVIQKLSTMYPEIEIEHWWADENIGYDTGYAVYKNGEIVIKIRFDPCTSMAYENYIRCWGECECLAKDENGNWYHKTCEECGNC